MMMYIVNGLLMDRNELVEEVLAEVKKRGEENSPSMAYRPTYPVEINVDRHACKIARAMGWRVEVA